MRKLLPALLALCLAPPAFGQDFLGKSRSDWLGELTDRRPVARRGAAFALGKAGNSARTTLARLVNALGDPDDGVRDAAAYALGEIASVSAENGQDVWDRAGEALQKALRQDRNPRVRRSAAFALGSCGEAAAPAVPALAEALKDDKAVVRRNAAWALGRVAKTSPRVGEVVDGLSAALEKDASNALVLRDVAGALGEIGRPMASPAARPLAELVRGSDDPVVRRTALTTLVSLVGPEMAEADADRNRAVVRVLHEALKESDARFKGLVAGALGHLGEHAGPAAPDLARLLDDPNAPADTRRNAVVALARMPKSIQKLDDAGRRAVIDALARALGPEQPRAVRPLAAEALARVGFPHVRPVLGVLLQAIKDDRDPVVRHRTLWAFLNVSNFDDLPGAEAVLVGALKEPHKPIRYDAARALASGLRGRAPTEVIDVLEEMLFDNEIEVYRKTDADVRAGGESSKGESNVRTDSGGDARFMAADALGLIGAKADRPRIRKELEKMLRSDDKRTRDSAELALDRFKR